MLATCESDRSSTRWKPGSAADELALAPDFAESGRRKLADCGRGTGALRCEVNGDQESEAPSRTHSSGTPLFTAPSALLLLLFLTASLL